MSRGNKTTGILTLTKIKNYITGYIEKNAMGLLGTLNLYIKPKYNTDAVTLFLNQPEELGSMLKKAYDPASAMLILRLFFIKPLLIITDNLDKTQDIDNILMEKEDIDQLYTIIKEIIENATQLK